MPLFKRCVVVINTRSGAREGLSVFSSALQQYLDRAGIIHHDVHVPHVSIDPALHQHLPKSECLIVCGGDGTVSSVANVLGMTAETELLRRPIVLVPTGLQNSIANSLGVTSAERSVSSFVMGRVDAVPLWEVRLDGVLARYVCSYVAVGTYAQIVSRFHAINDIGDEYVALPMPQNKFRMAAMYTALKQECISCTAELQCRGGKEEKHMHNGEGFAKRVEDTSSGDITCITYNSPIRMLLAAQMPLQHGGYTLTPEATYKHRTLSVTVATTEASRSRMWHLLQCEAREGALMEEDGVRCHQGVTRLKFTVEEEEGVAAGSSTAAAAVQAKERGLEGGVLMMLDGEPVHVARGTEVSVALSDRFLQFLVC